MFSPFLSSQSLISLSLLKFKEALIHNIVNEANKEMKLSVTLLIVTGVSVLTILPSAIYNSIPVNLRGNLSNASRLREIHHALLLIYFASSIVNPLIYTIRMQEFRNALRNLVSKNKEPSRDHPLRSRAHAVP